MCALPFRNNDSTPLREYDGVELKNYRAYKPHLRKDFKKKCGYTNCLDDWFGGALTFQIDHFLPISLHAHLKTRYSNLVYCCSYVNRAKSNDVGDYLDPCNVDYNSHFFRNEKGEIFPVSSSKGAVYMHKKLKLYLKRFSIIWMLEQLEQCMFKLEDLSSKSKDPEISILYLEIGKAYSAYKKYLRAQ